MLVIVGHGPSVLRGFGPWIDQQTVVRLKDAPRPDAHHFGTRIDYQCASTPLWLHLGVPTWVLPNQKDRGRYQTNDHVRVSDGRWWDYFSYFAPNYKMSTGLRAIFCAAEFLAPEEIALIGFDNILRPWITGLTKWHHPAGMVKTLHDYDAEHKAAHGLGIRLFEPADELCPTSTKLTQTQE